MTSEINDTEFSRDTQGDDTLPVHGIRKHKMGARLGPHKCV